MHKNTRRTTAAMLGLGLTLGVVAGPASARDSLPPDAVETDAVDVRPTDRPHRIEVLELSCPVADAGADDTRAHIGCRWRRATSDAAAGYQLWRIVDRGERELVGRVGLDSLGLRDVVPAGSKIVRYAVLAVNADGGVVGQSRVERIVLDRDTGPRPDAAPSRVRLRAAWPASVR